MSEANLPDVQLPQIANASTSVYAQYTILNPERDALQAKLKTAGIPAVAYYAKPLHLQPVFEKLGHTPGEFPVTEAIAAQCLSLPMSAYLAEEDQRMVVDALKL